MKILITQIKLLFLISTIVIGQVVHTIDEKTGDSMIVGKITRADIETEPFGFWFNEEYSGYEVYSDNQSLINDSLRNLEIEIFFGTWCGDSRQEVPRFYKIADSLNLSSDQLVLIAVDRAKHSTQGEEKGKDIRYVPTFIFYQNGAEIGRIVETPIRSLEDDFLDIILGLPYTPNYSEEE